ncbi:O-antigen ligase family protein [Cytophagaceae bacterium DM2B3-1]|uniref:O-antigen ligase family protein n=1 Tax=Xanthocytophaga flava TaxID=3048013 RepID=A0ABT7CVF6_9BACT|nr:O-antigen ligase family protein [Xanthocytophaga flavus]MDJ1497760.1 O-antigen ligase family protein [Xanthocytophaga flavus]
MLLFLYFSCKSITDIKIIILAFNSIVVLELVVFILQYNQILTNSNPNYLIGGSFGHPSLTSASLVIITPFFLHYLLEHQEKTFLRITTLLCLGISVFLLIFYQSRASILSFVLVCILYILLRKTKTQNIFPKNRISQYIGYLFGLIIILVVTYFGKRHSSDGRLYIWKKCIDIISQNPWLGTGYTNFAYVYNEYQRAYFSTSRSVYETSLADYTEQAYNQFLETCVEQGIPGLAILLLLLIVAATISLRSGKIFYFISLLSFIPILLGWSILKIFPITIIFVLLLSLISKDDSEAVFILKMNRWTRLLFLVVPVYFSFNTYHQFSSYLSLHELIKERNTKKIEKCFYNSYPYLHKDMNYQMEFINFLFAQGKYDSCIAMSSNVLQWNNNIYFYLTMGQCYYAKNEYKDALSAFKSANSAIPVKLYPRFLIAKTYYKMKRYNEGDSILLHALSSNVKVNTIETTMMLQQMKDLYKTKGKN